MLERLQDGDSIPLAEFTQQYDPVTKLILENGGILPFAKKLKDGGVELPPVSTARRGMTMAEKIIANKLIGRDDDACFVSPGDAVLATVDGGYSHEFTTAQVHNFLTAEYGADYTLPNPLNLRSLRIICSMQLVFQGLDHLSIKSRCCEIYKSTFQQHTGVRDYSAKDGVSPGICHPSGTGGIH